jgi:hypothetical protein
MRQVLTTILALVLGANAAMAGVILSAGPKHTTPTSGTPENFSVGAAGYTLTWRDQDFYWVPDEPENPWGPGHYKNDTPGGTVSFTGAPASNPISGDYSASGSAGGTPTSGTWARGTV